MKKKIRITAYGFDGGASRYVGVLFLEECSKTITNGSCLGHHNHVVVIEEKDEDSNRKEVR